MVTINVTLAAVERLGRWWSSSRSREVLHWSHWKRLLFLKAGQCDLVMKCLFCELKEVIQSNVSAG